jgi:hypothetical protein
LDWLNRRVQVAESLCKMLRHPAPQARPAPVPPVPPALKSPAAEPSGAASKLASISTGIFQQLARLGHAESTDEHAAESAVERITDSPPGIAADDEMSASSHHAARSGRGRAGASAQRGGTAVAASSVDHGYSDDEDEDDGVIVHMPKPPPPPPHAAQRKPRAHIRRSVPSAEDRPTPKAHANVPADDALPAEEAGRKPLHRPAPLHRRAPLHRPAHAAQHASKSAWGMAGMGRADRGQRDGEVSDRAAAHGEAGIPVISPVIVGIGLAVAFLMVIGAGVFVVRCTRRHPHAHKTRLSRQCFDQPATSPSRLAHTHAHMHLYTHASTHAHTVGVTGSLPASARE